MWKCTHKRTHASHRSMRGCGGHAVHVRLDATVRYGYLRGCALCRRCAHFAHALPLARRGTLSGMKEWYRQVRRRAADCCTLSHAPVFPIAVQVRGHNATALAFLVGTKYDLFYALEEGERAETLALARKYAKAMKAPLVFCSASHGINVQKLFKLVFQRVFSIEPDVEQKHDVADAVLEY